LTVASFAAFSAMILNSSIFRARTISVLAIAPLAAAANGKPTLPIRNEVILQICFSPTGSWSG
jgi:hypothetical protein